MRKLILIFLGLYFFAPNVSAEKIPVKFTPIQNISTNHNDIEVGDWIKFKVVNDVYYKNKVYIPKGAPLIGIVDYVHENGFFADNAEITFKKFITKDANNNKIFIPYTLLIDRKDYLTPTLSDKLAKYIGVIFKGNEIKIAPESINYNLFVVLD